MKPHVAVSTLRNSADPAGDAVLNEVLPAGTELLGGQYTIEGFLGCGGFAITYLARDSLERQVVIKECYPETLCSRRDRTVHARTNSQAGEFQSLVSMFVREARSIAKLRHPNIVGVHQVFEDNQTAYMALDLIQGKDLLRLIEETGQRMSPPKVRKMLLTLLDAIGTVHAQDMLHRDIAPDNILVDAWGNPILIDFGAAREQASKKSRAVSALLVVKDGYSPQEFYIAGTQQGPCSDLYSLAATFVHAITGAAPPDSQSRLAALAANRPDPFVPLAGQVRGYEPAFLRAIDKAMNVFPSERMQSAREWTALIGAADEARPALATSKTSENIKEIVSRFITEVRRSVEVEAKAAPEIEAEAEAAEPEKPAEKVWEYLLPEEPGADDEHGDGVAQPGARSKRRLLFGLFSRRPAGPPQGPDGRGAGRQPPGANTGKRFLAVVTLALAMVHLNDPGQLTALAGPGLQELIDLGRTMGERIN